MIFTEAAFFAFLAIVLPLYYATRALRATNNVLMLVASYFFYGWFDWRFTILLLLSSATDFYCALRVGNASTRVAARRWLIVGIVFSLSLLGIFKYSGLFADSVNHLALRLGSTAWLPVIAIALPAGISFYTFQSMSYLVDVYRREMEATKSLPTYLLYVAYFPQLVAGPIERAKHLLPQFFLPRVIRPDLIADGCSQILAGFLMKVVIADNLAPFVDIVYASPKDYLAPALLMATIFFGIQIYCDFAGYSNIAIGLGKVMGFDIMRNFNTPYFAPTLVDFWRRWHISLSTFFRDYLYHPLGGSRRTLFITLRNVVIVFLLSGLWHGANWTFVAWGAYHGVGLVIAILLGLLLSRAGVSAAGSMVLILSALLTQSFVTLGWIWFRAPSIDDALLIWRRIADASSYTSQQQHLLAPFAWLWIIVLLLFVAEAIQRRRQHLLDLTALSPWARTVCYIGCIIAVLLLGSGAQTQFIYFRF